MQDLVLLTPPNSDALLSFLGTLLNFWTYIGHYCPTRVHLFRAPAAAQKAALLLTQPVRPIKCSSLQARTLR